MEGASRGVHTRPHTMLAEYQALDGSEVQQTGCLQEAACGRHTHSSSWRAHAAGAALLMAVVLAGIAVQVPQKQAERAALAGLADARFVNATGTAVDNTTAVELGAPNALSEEEPPPHAADAVESAIKMAHNALQQQRFSLEDPLLADFPAEVTASMNLSTQPCDNFYEYAW